MDKEQIKQTYSMRDIVEQYGFRPSRAGFISCPFHNEKTASLKIYKDSYYCFGCGASGDIFDFVRHMDNLTFKEAFQFLGGTYAHEDKEEVRRKIRIAEEKRREKEVEKMALKQKKDMNNKYIEGLRNGIAYFPPLSDEWCFCQNELQKALYKHGELNDIPY